MRSAFTLIELMVVVIIMGIVASFAIPNFSKTMARAKARDAINNLNIIHSANLMYKARQGSNVVADDLADINTVLGLNIIANGATYSCGDDSCSGIVDDGFNVNVELNEPLAANNPSCSGFGCP